MAEPRAVLARETCRLLAALMFYTRVPCPRGFEHRDEYLEKSRVYFPLMGCLVGAVAALVYGAAALLWPVSVALLLSMVASIRLTGAFHEDGFADACDGFGGGWDKAQILTIMKDSRLGTYGSVGLGLLLALKFATLLELARLAPLLPIPVLIAGHALSRLLASTVVQRQAYVQDLDLSRAKPIATSRLSPAEMTYSGLFALLPLLALWPWPELWLAVLPAWAAGRYLSAWFRRRIGGYTGDCLGAVQQVCELAFYLGVLALCRST